jgi:predicted RNA-binding protein with TRAM domain
MTDLQPTDLIHGEITRISNRGNGILDYGHGEISIGPVRPESVGEKVDAVVYDEDHAFCLDERVQTDYYDNTIKAQTGQLLENPPSECPGLGEEIDVEIEGINSSQHGPAAYRGIPVRVRNIPENVSIGETIPVKVYRIEPRRLVGSGLTDFSIRGRLPDIGDRFTAKITHRTNSGRGLVEEFVDQTVNVGPIRKDAIGNSIDVILLNNEWDTVWTIR